MTMTNQTWMPASLVLMLALQGCAVPKPGPATAATPQDVLKLLPRLIVPSGVPLSCTAFPCTVPVEMHPGEVNGKPYCLAILPDPINLPSPSSGEKTIVWKLNTASLGNADLYFQPDFGVLVLDDNKGQIRECKKGNGQGGLSPTEFHCKHKHNQSKADTTYVPIILQRDRTSKEVSMCGAADPRIVNGE